VTDHSGFFHRGEIRGAPTLVPGLVGQALALDGKGDFVETDDRAMGDVGTSSFTLDAWVKTSASGFQPIVADVGGVEDDDAENGVEKPASGYALFLDDGRLGLFLGTVDRQGVFSAGATDGGTGSIADGAWHHVAAVVDREYAPRSKLFVDGTVVLEFDATPFAGDATSHARLRIGQLNVGRLPQLHRQHAAQSTFFQGQLDELDLFRSALRPDLVASVAFAGSAGKYGSLGNLPTTAGQPACIEALGQKIASLPQSVAALTSLYSDLQAAIAAGHLPKARAVARQLADEAETHFAHTYASAPFHGVAMLADACLDVPPLSHK
jgi:hypothetical protein